MVYVIFCALMMKSPHSQLCHQVFQAVKLILEKEISRSRKQDVRTALFCIQYSAEYRVADKINAFNTLNELNFLILRLLFLEVLMPENIKHMVRKENLILARKNIKLLLPLLIE
jgi:hypothetical protein